MTADPDIAVVRAALGSGDRLVPGTISEAEAEAFAALDRLEARLREAEVERDAARRATWKQDTRAEAAEMRAEAAEDERDEARLLLKDEVRMYEVMAAARDEMARECAAAEAEVARLREALTYARDAIASPDIPYAPGKDIYDTHMMMGAMRRADAALAAEETTK